MDSFPDSDQTTSSQDIRAWCVDRAIASASGIPVTDEELVNTSNAIEQFVLKGKDV